MPLILAGATSGSTTLQATDAVTATITLPSTSGTVVVNNGAQTIEFADGSASAPSITNSGDTNTGIFFPAADTIAFSEGGTESMRIDSAGNLGLGVTPSAWDSSFRALQMPNGAGFAGASDVSVYVLSNVNYSSSAFKYVVNDFASMYQQYNGVHSWHTTASGTAGNAITFTQAMTLDSGGNLLIGATSTGTSVGARIYPTGLFASSRASADNSVTGWDLYSTGAGAYRFYVGMGGTVYATSTTISSISDVRFKENVRDLNVGLAEVMALKPRLYDWKEGKGANIKNARGFIAQEFEEVFPDLIDEWKDPAPEGEEAYKSVRQDLIPVLVKAIQEQQAMIDELKAKVAALEAA